MSKDKHLTKEEELRLGFLVQDMLKSREILNNGEKIAEAERSSLNHKILLGENAVATLVEAYTGLVHNKARAFKSKYPGAPELEDLVQDGMAGLLNGIYHYDPSRGNKVSTVVTYWIFQSITRWTNKTGRLVKLPENRVSDFTKISKMRVDLDRKGYSQKEADEKIMKELKLSDDDIYYITNAASTPASLNKVVSTDESTTKELMDIVTENQTSESSEDTVVKDAVYKILSDCFDLLTEVQIDTVASTFMLDGFESGYMNAKQVREKHGITPSKFKRHLNEALKIIREQLDELGISSQDFFGFS